MINLETLKSVFGGDGEDLHRYLIKKNIGGTNNAKGATFENLYSVYRIAKAFNDGAEAADTFFSAQQLVFVDDLLIEEPGKKIEFYFQLKDIQALKWKSGDHPLEDDFRYQYSVSSASGITAKLAMVVSRKDLRDSLVTEMPDDLKAFTVVIHFETATSINNLIRNNSQLKAALINMCALTDPATDKLDTLGSILLAAWDGTDKNKVSLKDLLDKSRGLNPNYIKGQANQISDKLSGILQSIPHFSFTLENSFLKWSYQKTDEGVLAYRIGSLEYEQWESDVFRADIKTFEDLESFLSS